MYLLVLPINAIVIKSILFGPVRLSVHFTKTLKKLQTEVDKLDFISFYRLHSANSGPYICYMFAFTTLTTKKLL